MIKNMQQQSKNSMYLVYDENLNFGAGKIDLHTHKSIKNQTGMHCRSDQWAKH